MIEEKIQNIILHIDGGIGKNIIATGMVNELRYTYPTKNIIVVTAWDEPWIANKNCNRVYNFQNMSYFYDDYINNKDSYVIRHDPYHSSDYIMRNKHISEAWSSLAGLSGEYSTPEIILTERELEFTYNLLNIDQRPIFLIHPNGGGDKQGLPYSWARDMPFGLSQEIVNRMNKLGYRTIQLGRQNQKVLEGAELLSSTIRVACCAIHFSTKRLLIDSFPQHAAVALNKKSTVLWIANKPSMIGHKFHDNIVCPKEYRKDATRNSYLEPFNILGELGEYPFDNGPLFDVDHIMEILNTENFTKQL